MRRRSPLILTIVAVAVAMIVAGCGGGSSPGIANVNSSTSTSSASSGGPPTEAQIQRQNQEADRFAQCMRAHGVSIPDPTVAPHAFKNAFETQSPGFRSADSVCGHLLPAGRPPNQNPAPTRAQVNALLAFAGCLRSHGFPSFPDPTGSGELTHQMLASARIDLHQPALVHAADACTSVTHGVITKAVVAHFVAGH